MPRVGRAALLLLALAGASCSPAPSADAPDRVVIAHFGDSTCSTDYLPAPLHIARERQYPLVEVFARLRREVTAGNWDLCIRNDELSQKRFGRQIVDDSKDGEMAGAPDWFRNPHPNFRAVTITADEEFRTLTAAWPGRLPKAGAG